MTDDNEIDYESMPSSSTMSTHMVAGAAAGIMEHCVMYPVDCVKVFINLLSSSSLERYGSIGISLGNETPCKGVFLLGTSRI